MVSLELGGVKVEAIDRTLLLDVIESRSRHAGIGLIVASANLDHLYHFGKGGKEFGKLDESAIDWLVTLDGMPLVWAANRITGMPCEQLAGSDLLPDVLDRASQARARVGFLGGDSDMHAVLRKVVTQRFPALTVAGYWSPERRTFLSEEESRRLAGEISGARVDLLVVGLGKPLQELWLTRHMGMTGVKVALAFGASADFLAGAARRAPVVWRRVGLEWLYRLLHEPRRLWKRYLLHGPRAAWRLLRWSGRQPAA